MKELDRIIKIIKEHEEILQNEYFIKSLSIFGSISRGQDAEASDIDILVEFSRPIGFGFFRAARYLEEITGRKIDLVTKDAIKPEIANNIMKDLIHV